MLLALLLAAAGSPCAPCVHHETSFLVRPLLVVTSDTLDDGMILGLRAMVDEQEIETAQWAASHASAQPVREFARSLLRGHANAQNDAKAVAAQLKLELATPADSDSAIVRRHTQEMATLRMLSGSRVDRVFLEEVRDDHVSEIAKVNTWYLPAAKHNGVKEYLNSILPTLNSHEQGAEKLLASMSVASQ